MIPGTNMTKVNDSIFAAVPSQLRGPAVGLYNLVQFARAVIAIWKQIIIIRIGSKIDRILRTVCYTVDGP